MSLQRYGIVRDGFMPRETVLLQANRCSWGKCKFCDYRLDNVPLMADAATVNRHALSNVTGETGVLVVIDSACWTDLPVMTLLDIHNKAEEKRIHTVIFEGHWMNRFDIMPTRQFFADAAIKTKFIVGLETLDKNRSTALYKGPHTTSVAKAAEYFDAVNLMHGDNYSLQADDFMLELTRCANRFDFVNLSIFTDNLLATRNGVYRSPMNVEHFYEAILPLITKHFENVFVFDYGDSRAPHNLGGVGNTI